MSKCPGCKKPVGGEVGESSIYGSYDVGDLCLTCFDQEEALIEVEGTNDPQYSEVIAARLELYRTWKIPQPL